MAHYLLDNMNDPFAKLEAGQDFVDFSQFDGSKAFDTMGFADSEGAVNGRAGTQEVDGDKLDKLELQREKREKRDKTNELIELGFSMREARITDVTYANGQFHMYGMSIDKEDMDAQVTETLQNIDSVAEKHNLGGQEQADLTALLMAYQQAASPQEQAEILEKITEQQPEIAYEISEKAFERQEVRTQSELTNDERQDENISSLDTAEEREVFAIKVVQDTDSIEIAEVSRGVISLGNENPFADTRNVSAAFNASASGIVVAEVAPQNVSEARTNAPVLSNG